MSELSKQALKVDNSQSFPNNNNGVITPAILRSFNEDMIDSTVNQTTYNSDSASFTDRIEITDGKVEVLEAFSSSQHVLNETFATTGSNTFDGTITVSGSIVLNDNGVSVTLEPNSGVNGLQISNNVNVDGLFSADLPLGYVWLGDGNGKAIAYPSASLVAGGTTDVNNLNQFTQSQEQKDIALGIYTASNDTKWNNLGSQSGSFVTESETGSFARTNVSNTFSATQNITGDLNITGTITATTIHTITESASVIFSSGSNVFGDDALDTQTLNGAVVINNTLSVGGVSFSSFSQSVDSRLDSIEVYTQSQDTKNSTLATYTGSVDNTLSILNQFTQSQSNLNLTFATTGSNTFVGKQIVDGLYNGVAMTGSHSYIDLSGYNSHISVYSGTGSIRFYSGSADGDGTSNLDTWVNMQVNPANGALAISSFPANNHFVDFDVEQTASLFTAPLKGMVGNLRIISGVEITGSLYTTPASVSTNANYPITFVSGSTYSKDSVDTLLYNPSTNTLLVSASTGNSSISPNAITFQSGSGAYGTYSSAVSKFGFVNSVEGGNYIALQGNPSKSGAPSLATSTKPAILALSGSGQPYPAIEFQPSASFTDGAITVKRKLVGEQGSEITGSVNGNVLTQSITATTASLNLNTANFFELTLVSGTDTRVEATNVKPGQTINLLVKQPAVSGNGTISFSSQFDFPAVAPYVATVGDNAKDIVTFITFSDTSAIHAVAVKNLI